MLNTSETPHQIWPWFLIFGISIWVILSLRRSLQKLREGYENELDLPDDIIIEILSRLPVESLLRFKCVCKSWRSIIQDRKFIEKHYSHSKCDYAYEENTEFKPIVYGSRLLLEKNRNMTKKYRLRNPSTRQILDLPNVLEKFVHMSFVYLPSVGKCKLVYTFRNEGTRNGGCKVLTPGMDLSWRTIDIPSLYNLRTNGERIVRRTIKDVYFVARFFTSSQFHGSHELVFLELESESFANINIPQNFFKDWRNVGLLNWKSKLSLWRRADKKLYVCVLEDYRKQKWAKRKIVISLTFLSKYPVDPEKFIPSAVRNGRLWFSPYDRFHLSYNIKSQKDYCITAPPGKKFASYVYPSLTTL